MRPGAAEQLIDDEPAVVVVVTWDNCREVITNLRHQAAGMDWDPRFWVPLPNPGFLTV
jgi:hypothetical protein